MAGRREATIPGAHIVSSPRVAGGSRCGSYGEPVITRGALGYVLVLAGGLVVSVVPASSPVAHLPLVGVLRESMPGRICGLAVVVVGLGVAASAWLGLVRYVRRVGRVEDTSLLPEVRRATLAWCAPLLLAPAMFSRDGWSYAAQGEMTRRGISPYASGPTVLDGPLVEAVDPRWMDTPTPYGPVPLAWGAAAATLTQDPWLLVIAHRVLALAGLALLGYAVPRLAARAGIDPAYASVLVLPSPLMLAHGVAGLHNDLVMVGLMAAALVVAIERTWLPAAVLGGVAAAVKLPGGLVCVGIALVSLPVIVSWGGRARRLVAVALVAVGTLLGLGIATGLGVGWVHALGVPGEVRTPLSLSTQLGQVGAWGLRALHLSDTGGVAVTLARLAGTAVALAIVVRVGFRARTGLPHAAVRAVALVMLAVVVLGPVVHHWYLLWFVPLLAAGHLSDRSSGALLHGSWLAGLVAPLDSSLEGAGAEILVTGVLVGGIAAAQLRTHRSASSPGGAPPVVGERLAS